MAPKTRTEYRETVAKAFLDCLGEKGLEWKQGWDAISMAPQNAITKTPYHGINQFYLGLLAMNMGYTDPRWATMAQIMDKDGKYHPGEKWHLQKGSKAVYVEYWYAWNPKEKKALTWREYRKLSEAEQEDYMPRARYTPVFHASMIDGIAPYQAVEREPRKLVDIVVQLTNSMGVGMEFDGGGSAFYRPSEDKIHMPTPDKFFSDYEFNATVLHELAHATGHESRLDRPHEGHFGSPEYAYEELVAEISSCFMGVTLDMEQTPQHLENHKAYVQSWIQAITDKPETLMAAIRDAQKAADYMDYHAGLVNEQVHQAVQENSAVIPVPTVAAPEQTSPLQAKQQSEVMRSGWSFTGGRVVANAEKNRLQVIFDNKPSDAVRAELKANGFHWATSARAWQRPLTDDAYRAVAQITSIQPDAKKEQAERLSQNENAAARRGSGEEMYSLNTGFETAYDQWLENYPDKAVSLYVGNTSAALRSVGVRDSRITWDTRKIQKIKAEHPGMTDQVLKQVPNIIEKPVLIMQSKQFASRLTMFGTVMDENGAPILAVLELHPTNRGGVELDELKIASAYGKEVPQNLINTSDILYVDPDTERTDGWLRDNRLHLPFSPTTYGPVHSISETGRKVNTRFPQKDPFRVRENRPWSPVTRSGKLHYTNDQYRVAREASALEYARRQGYHLVRDGGGRYHLEEHDSMIFLPNGKWHWNSRDLHGGAIEFLTFYEGKSLPEAVLELNGIDYTATRDGAWDQTVQKDDTPRYAPSQEDLEAAATKREFVLPPRAEKMSRAFSYLCNTRGLDYDLVRRLVHDRRIYESENRRPDGTVLHNVVFVGFDQQGTPRSASLRGCSQTSKFKLEQPGSDKTHPFTIPGRQGSDTLYVFESAIDAASHATIQKLAGLDWQSGHRIGQGGNAPKEAILNVLETHPEIQRICVCTDNDAAGEKIYQKTLDRLVEQGISKDRIQRQIVPVGKDWNEYLQTWRETVKNYQELPATEYADQGHGKCCGRIHFLDADGVVSRTVAYTNKDHFKNAAAEQLRTLRPCVVETPAQLAELQRSNERRANRQRAEQGARQAEETLDRIRADGEPDLDKERSREHRGFRDNAPSETAQRMSMEEQLAAASVEANQRNQDRQARAHQIGQERETS